MEAVNRSIFRTDALRRYMQDSGKPVLPRIISPRTFLCLWVLLGLLVVSGFIAWFTDMPAYASGSAIFVGQGDQHQNTGTDELTVVALLPPESHLHLRAGQTMFLRSDATGERITAAVTAVESEIISPDTARKRFAPSFGTALAINQPVAVATARLESNPGGLPSSNYAGSVYLAEVEIGSRRIISLLPIFGGN